MMTMKLLFKLFVLCTILTFCFFAPPARAELFGISSPYNNVFFGDFYGRNGDVEGHAAIKGNLDVSAYSFGAGEQNLHPDRQWVLVVGGNAVVSSTTVFDGDAYIGGTLKPPTGGSMWNTLGAAGTGPYHENPLWSGYVGTAGTVYVAGTPDANLDPTYQKNTDWAIPFDFDLAESQLRNVSATLWGITDTIVSGYVGGYYTIDLTGQTGLQVVTIDASIFNALGNQNIYINAGADTTLIINVTDNNNLGTLNLRKEFVINGSFVPFYNEDFDGSNILINTDISNVNVYGAAINASIMALNAHFDVQHGNIDGQAFGASANTSGGGEFHAYYVFDDKHFKDNEPPTTVPEPATCMILVCSLLGLGYANRRCRTS